MSTDHVIIDFCSVFIFLVFLAMLSFVCYSTEISLLFKTEYKTEKALYDQNILLS